MFMDGYEVVRSWMIEHTGFDVYMFLTTQSMASTFMLTSGCYQHVYQISGALQQCITKCVVGGRVATASNKQYHVKQKITYVDACSLYPSAMYKMDGALEGKPQILHNTSYEFLQQQYGYFIRIETVQLNKH